MIGAVVLAAGASSRMGRPKALLDVGGTTFLEHILATLAAGGVRDVRVVLGVDAAAIRSAVALREGVVVVNRRPGDGMLSSVRLGVSALPDGLEGFLLWPVDHPTVTAGTVAALVAASRAAGARIAIPVHRGRRGHPAFFAASLRGELLAAPDHIGARAVVLAHPGETAEVPVGDAGVVADIDDPEAYARLAGRPVS